MRNKELWFQIRLLSNKLREDHSISDGGVVCVSIPAQTSTLQLKYQVYRQLNLVHIVDDEKVVFKLRDPSGALIPLSNQLESNDSARPFILEVVDIHQHIEATDWQTPDINRTENLTSQIGSLNDRVEDLEHRMDDLSEDYADKLAEELQFLSNQTADLKKLMVDVKNE
ncbi:uncharacterized protein LOC130687712 isoform X2 [Daphnia carinata]|uniref:uncharacterized protein LOC130687712 isoform X2 n=1 Tax=Daphnia carinata TaxID=120202 RepID=UPI00257B6BA6|nr:uncharacterized protein LOC130687712 isoform X2 [Daphnia carinata]